MIKVAIPVTGDLLSKDFGACSYIVVFEINDKKIINKKNENSLSLSHDSLLKWVDNMGITDVIVHGINNNSVQLFTNTKINLFVGVTINTPDNLIEQYLRGTLQSNAQSVTTFKM